MWACDELFGLAFGWIRYPQRLLLHISVLEQPIEKPMIKAWNWMHCMVDADKISRVSDSGKRHKYSLIYSDSSSSVPFASSSSVFWTNASGSIGLLKLMLLIWAQA